MAQNGEIKDQCGQNRERDHAKLQKSISSNAEAIQICKEDDSDNDSLNSVAESLNNYLDVKVRFLQGQIKMKDEHICF